MLQISPWPAALVIRAFFDVDGTNVARALRKHVPTGVDAFLDEHYDAHDPDAYLDVFSPRGGASGPAVVWVHGGGWVAGSRKQVGNYARILAGRGFTVAAVGYSIAPRATYPTPVRQINAALAYLKVNAARLRVDAARFVLAGDSAGAHIAAQLANAVTLPEYARAIGITPAIRRAQLAGMLLYCGAFTIDAVNLSGPFGMFLDAVRRSYSGVRDYLSDPRFAPASLTGYVTRDFPPSFVSAGNGDPLLSQSLAFAEALEAQSVQVERFFPSAAHRTRRHGYQFRLEDDAARQALDRSVAFLNSLP